jgi:hypothetical protein
MQFIVKKTYTVHDVCLCVSACTCVWISMGNTEKGFVIIKEVNTHWWKYKLEKELGKSKTVQREWYGEERGWN